MSSFHQDDTITAIATPPGEGAIAIIRISGKEALKVADKVYSGKVFSFKSHTAHYGEVLDAKGRVLDRCLLLVMLGSRSYTGEDTVELYCHGGIVVSKLVLERVLEAGARPAGPGEFTFRAFMHGKLDLAQAEAVQQLIGAKNEKALLFAQDHLQGRLSHKIGEFQKELTLVAANIEAWLDFPDEEIERESLEELQGILQGTMEKMVALIRTFEEGRRVHAGLSLCITGLPNVGKSSLMNALLGQERAIVTPIAGTTRDLVDADFILKGIHCRLIDGAGIRSTQDPVEREGVLRAKEAVKKADVTLFVLDASREIEEEERSLLKSLSEKKSVVIWNKIDLPECSTPPLSHPHVVQLSAKSGRGIEALCNKLETLIGFSKISKEEVIISAERHKKHLSEALESCERGLQGLKEDRSLEFIAADIRFALCALGKILGTDVTEDILSAVFSTFCIGK